MFFEDLKVLNIPLPEDLRKVKGYGDYARLRRMLDLRIADARLPRDLRTRLKLEKRMIERIPGDYPHDYAAALQRLQDALEGFTAEELEDCIDAGKVDFIYLNGEMRFHRLFLDTLVKTRPELAPRLKDPALLDYKKANFAALDAVIREMRQNGGAARRWHVRHALRVKPEYRHIGEEILVHLPLPVEYDCVRGFRLIDCGPGRGHVSEAGQRTIAFRKPLADDDEFFAEYTFDVFMTYHDLDPALARPGVPEGEDCLGEQPPHIAFTPLIKSVAREIAGDETNPLLLARRVYDFLI